MAKTWTVSSGSTTITTGVGDTFTYSFNENTHFCEELEYKISVTDENGCSAEKEMKVPARKPEFTVSSIVCEGDALYANVTMTNVPECDLAYTGRTTYLYKNTNGSWTESDIGTITPSNSFKVNIGKKPSYYESGKNASFYVILDTGVSYYSQQVSGNTPSCDSVAEEIYEPLASFEFNIAVSTANYYFDFIVVEGYLVGKDGQKITIKAMTDEGVKVDGYDYPCYIYKNINDIGAWVGTCSNSKLEKEGKTTGYGNWKYTKLSDGVVTNPSDIYVKLRFLSPTLRMGQNNNCGTVATPQCFDGKFKVISGSEGREFISSVPLDKIGSTYFVL